MSKPRSAPTVALVDTRWVGHHPTYLREFTASLLRIGARALVVCKEPDEVLASLPPEARSSEAAMRVHGLRFLHRNHGVINRRRDHDPLSTVLRWRASGKIVRAAEIASGWTADLVFFCYLDSYLRFAPFPGLPGITLGRPWSGLYFRNAHLDQRLNGHSLLRAAKGDRLLRSASCKAACVLDERFNDTLAALSGHPVIQFPDMTDESPPDPHSERARQIAERAAGRTVIGLVSMERRKGLLTLLRCALRAHEAAEPWFFVATGPFLRHTFTTEEIAFCEDVARRSATGEINNLWFDTDCGRIPDGPPFNAIFNRFDIVWAAYEGFQGSSNALTKAAVFRKRVLATAGECIGARVERHHLGTTFPEGNVQACLTAIRQALLPTAPQPQFDTYHQLHSRQHLDKVFTTLISLSSHHKSSIINHKSRRASEI